MVRSALLWGKVVKQVRCATYTRKSTDEGLDQAFNSLDAQREACAAYILSQQHEGWVAVDESYDDGGYSGGHIERPGLRGLFDDIDAGKVDMVVVYKIDRLTRSLTDFAKLVERLDAAGASFVSVTQQFNTSTSMGRLTLNVLLSFAQFEREVTAERIRDKIAASKKKGMWMGGPLPLGYDKSEAGLVINPDEARTVRSIFDAYLRLGCVRKLKAFADNNDLRTKRQVFRSGRESGGVLFSRGRLYHLLANPIYVGRVRHKSHTYPGQHDAILDDDTWNEVQRQLHRNRVNRKSRTNAANPSPLAGKLFDENGEPLVPSHSNKNGRRYRYYVSRHHCAESGSTKSGWRLPATELERVIQQAMQQDRDVQLLIKSEEHRATPFALAHRVDIGASSLSIQLLLPDDEVRSITTPFTHRRRGVETRIIIPGAQARAPDQHLIRRILQAMKRVDQIKSGSTLSEIADAENTCPEYLSKNLDLAFLSPMILKAIASGRQDPTISVSHFHSKRLPVAWEEQEPIFLDSGEP